MKKKLYFIGDCGISNVLDFFNILVEDGRKKNYDVLTANGKNEKEVEYRCVVLFCATPYNYSQRAVWHFLFGSEQLGCTIPVKFTDGEIPAHMANIASFDIDCNSVADILLKIHSVLNIE